MLAFSSSFGGGWGVGIEVVVVLVTGGCTVDSMGMALANDTAGSVL